jgi:hypothetical protein
MRQGSVGGPNDSAEIAEGFFIDTVISEKPARRNQNLEETS